MDNCWRNLRKKSCQPKAKSSSRAMAQSNYTNDRVAKHAVNSGIAHRVWIELALHKLFDYSPRGEYSSRGSGTDLRIPLFG